MLRKEVLCIAPVKYDLVYLHGDVPSDADLFVCIDISSQIHISEPMSLCYFYPSSVWK